VISLPSKVCSCGNFAITYELKSGQLLHDNDNNDNNDNNCDDNYDDDIDDRDHDDDTFVMDFPSYINLLSLLMVLIH
jgi:hypothetical protein